MCLFVQLSFYVNNDQSMGRSFVIRTLQNFTIFISKLGDFLDRIYNVEVTQKFWVKNEFQIEIFKGWNGNLLTFEGKLNF